MRQRNFMNKELREIIQSDIFRHYGCQEKPLFWKFHNPSLYYQIIFRKANYYNCIKKRKMLGLFYRYQLNRLSRKLHIQIPYTARVGMGLNIVHYGRLIISPFAKIGDNCNIFTGVTIGSTNRGEKKGVPTIGNKVWIGPNVVIVGGVKIGDNVLIAANTFINFDVPDNSIVIGGSGVVKSNSKATDSYICQIYNKNHCGDNENEQ